MTTLSRRSALTGLAAATLTASPAIAAAGSIGPDAELIARCRSWHEMKRQADGLYDIVDRLDGEAEAMRPETPPELSEPLAFPFGAKGPEGGRPWTAEALKFFAAGGPEYHATREDDGNKTVITSAAIELSPATRARAAELLAIRERHDAELERINAPAEAAEIAAGDFGNQVWDDAVELVSLQALTMEGLMAKVAVIRATKAFEYFGTDGLTEMGLGMIADIEALAGHAAA